MTKIAFADIAKNLSPITTGQEAFAHLAPTMNKAEEYNGWDIFRLEYPSGTKQPSTIKFKAYPKGMSSVRVGDMVPSFNTLAEVKAWIDQQMAPSPNAAMTPEKSRNTWIVLGVAGAVGIAIFAWTMIASRRR
jgi:hypothetical protein